MKKVRSGEIALPEYARFIETLKCRVAAARLTVARAVNRDLILLYWDIGQAILEKQEKRGWGDSVVEMVAKDLRRAFPGSKGFSPQNVWRMLQFYRTHTASEFLSQVVREVDEGTQPNADTAKLSQRVRDMVALVPWGHHANALGQRICNHVGLYSMWQN